jgi:hypothetical protein
MLMSQTTLNELTQEQEALCEIIFREYDAVLDTLPREAKMGAIQSWLKVAYLLYDLPVPARIEVVDSPFAAFELEKKLTGSSDHQLDWCGIADAAWVSFYDYFHRIGILTDADEGMLSVLALREFQRNVWDTILLDECAIVVALPTLLKRDDNGNLHNASGPCIEWRDGNKDFAWHGVWVPERLIVDPKSYSLDEYNAITSTEVRRAYGESSGWDHVVQLLKGECVDAWVDPKTNLTYELWRAGSQNWLKKQSPILQIQGQPHYFEPVHENLRTARAARKWQATARIGWTPEECDREPELSYGVET